MKLSQKGKVKRRPLTKEEEKDTLARMEKIRELLEAEKYNLKAAKLYLKEGIVHDFNVKRMRAEDDIAAKKKLIKQYQNTIETMKKILKDGVVVREKQEKK